MAPSPVALLASFARTQARAIGRAGARALSLARTVDRRLVLRPEHVSACASWLGGLGLVTALAVVAGGGCGPRHAAGPRTIGETRVTGGAPPAVDEGSGTIAPPGPTGGEPIVGRAVRITMYHLAAQPCPDPAQVPLPRCGGGSIALVSAAFRKSAAMQGSARLCDGRVVGVRKVSPLCFAVVEGSAWGMTASGRPATPFRSIAVDPKQFPLGRWYFVPELVGVPLPAPAEGKVHDGCVRADDVGGAVKGALIDFFVGTHGAVDALKDRFSSTTVHLADGEARCAAAAQL